jgi:hypothetical protein
MEETRDDLSLNQLVRVAKASGQIVELRPTVSSSELLLVLRQRVAAALHTLEPQVSLLYAGRELMDDSLSIAEQCPLESQGPIEVTLVQRPCRARPHEYQDHIGPPENDQMAYARPFKHGQEFPEPRGININMMPFRMGDKSSLPEDLYQYWPMISLCTDRDERGKIGFLTIQESQVEQGQSQRRPGLHVESPKVLMNSGGSLEEIMHPWGISLGWRRKGGLYMGSNVSNSCRIWNCKLTDPEAIVGPLGSVEHLRECLGEGDIMEAGQLWWLTDLTPHESLPMEQSVHRQYFRLVTSSVGMWYEQHNTANPLGIVPDPQITQVVAHNKFHEADGLLQEGC